METIAEHREQLALTRKFLSNINWLFTVLAVAVVAQVAFRIVDTDLNADYAREAVAVAESVGAVHTTFDVTGTRTVATSAGPALLAQGTYTVNGETFTGAIEVPAETDRIDIWVTSFGGIRFHEPAPARFASDAALKAWRADVHATRNQWHLIAMLFLAAAFIHFVAVAVRTVAKSFQLDLEAAAR